MTRDAQSCIPAFMQCLVSLYVLLSIQSELNPFIRNRQNAYVHVIVPMLSRPHTMPEATGMVVVQRLAARHTLDCIHRRHAHGNTSTYAQSHASSIPHFMLCHYTAPAHQALPMDTAPAPAQPRTSPGPAQHSTAQHSAGPGSAPF